MNLDFRKPLAVLGGFLLAHGAVAYDPSVNAPQVVLRISGATANDTALRDLLTAPSAQGGVCLDGFTKSYFADRDPVVDDQSRLFTVHFGVACTADGTTIPGLSGQQRVLVLKSSVGGSGQGVGPVCTGGNRPFLNVTAAGACTLDSTVGGFDQYNCGSNVADSQTLVGISDVGPREVFGGTASTACGANVFGAFNTVFGVPVTTKLRDALQIAQGIAPCKASEGSCTGDPAWWTNDDDLDGVPNAEEADNQPSLSSALVHSIKIGSIPRWSNVLVRDPNNGGALTPLNSIVGLGDLDPDLGSNYTPVRANGDNRVSVCRRVDSSGTFATDSIVLNRRSCVAGAAAQLGATSSITDGNGPVVLPLASSSSNIEFCLTNMNNGVNYNINQGGTSKVASIWAVGQISTDRVPAGPDKNTPDTTRDGWRFVKLDGKLPTFENLANGSYYLYAESTIQWASPTILSDDQLAIAERVRDGAASADVIGSLGREHFWGRSGLMGYGTPVIAGGQYDDTRPVTPLTRGANNCLVARKAGSFNALLEP